MRYSTLIKIAIIASALVAEIVEGKILGNETTESVLIPDTESVLIPDPDLFFGYYRHIYC